MFQTPDTLGNVTSTLPVRVPVNWIVPFCVSVVDNAYPLTTLMLNTVPNICVMYAKLLLRYPPQVDVSEPTVGRIRPRPFVVDMF